MNCVFAWFTMTTVSYMINGSLLHFTESLQSISLLIVKLLFSCQKEFAEQFICNRVRAWVSRSCVRFLNTRRRRLASLFALQLVHVMKWIFFPLFSSGSRWIVLLYSTVYTRFKPAWGLLSYKLIMRGRIQIMNTHSSPFEWQLESGWSIRAQPSINPPALYSKRISTCVRKRKSEPAQKSLDKTGGLRLSDKASQSNYILD